MINPEELIDTEELCIRYKVERTFIHSLKDSGLLEIISVEQKEYIHCDRMQEFEKMHRLYFDLNINFEGIEAIYHLLQQVRELQDLNIQLRNRLGLYE
jgi:chaperone modulatory protein CbpM